MRNITALRNIFENNGAHLIKVQRANVLTGKPAVWMAYACNDGDPVLKTQDIAYIEKPLFGRARVGIYERDDATWEDNHPLAASCWPFAYVLDGGYRPERIGRPEQFASYPVNLPFSYMGPRAPMDGPQFEAIVTRPVFVGRELHKD